MLSLAVSTQSEVTPILSDVYTRYGEHLAAQGQLEVALRYLGNVNTASAIKTSAGQLFHRIQHALGNDRNGIPFYHNLTLETMALMLTLQY